MYTEEKCRAVYISQPYILTPPGLEKYGNTVTKKEGAGSPCSLQTLPQLSRFSSNCKETAGRSAFPIPIILSNLCHLHNLVLCNIYRECVGSPYFLLSGNGHTFVGNHIFHGCPWLYHRILHEDTVLYFGALAYLYAAE